MQNNSPFWASVDATIAELALIAFQCCDSHDEMIYVGRRIKRAVERRYPNNPGKKKLLNQLSQLWANEDNELTLPGPGPAPAPPVQPVDTGFNTEA